MALHGNRSVLHKSPVRFLNGALALLRSNFSKHGMVRGAGYSPVSGIPYGHLAPSAWVLPRTAGAMSSHNFAKIEFASTAAGAMGVPIEGDAAFSITFAAAPGQLISSGTGAASFSITGTGNVLAVLAGVGTASFTMTTNAPLLGAQAWQSATASFAITGALTPYARGMMTGSTVDNTALTPAAILAAMNADPPAVNIKKVNDVAVTGDGQTGTEWGPA